MVKSETRRDAEILVRNLSPRLFGKKFPDSKKVKTNHAKTRFRDLSKTLPRFRDPAKIFRDPRFSRYHSPPLIFFLRRTIISSAIRHKSFKFQFMSIIAILYIRQQETVLRLKIEGKVDRTAKGYKFISRPQIYSSIINKTGPLF